jgi:hypothetical protein
MVALFPIGMIAVMLPPRGATYNRDHHEEDFMKKSLQLIALLSSSVAWSAMEIPLRGVYAPIDGYQNNKIEC